MPYLITAVMGCNSSIRNDNDSVHTSPQRAVDEALKRALHQLMMQRGIQKSQARTGQSTEKNAIEGLSLDCIYLQGKGEH